MSVRDSPPYDPGRLSVLDAQTAAGVIRDRLYVTGGFWERVDDVCNCKETWAFPFPTKQPRRLLENAGTWCTLCHGYGGICFLE